MGEEKEITFVCKPIESTVKETIEMDYKKEYKTYNLYAIYKDDKFLYKTCISNIKDNYKKKNQWG